MLITSVTTTADAMDNCYSLDIEPGVKFIIILLLKTLMQDSRMAHHSTIIHGRKVYLIGIEGNNVQPLHCIDSLLHALQKARNYSTYACNQMA